MKRWMLNCIVILVASGSFVRCSRADEPPTTADLKITFYYESDTNPTPVRIDTSSNPWCSANPNPLYYENLIVDSKTYGIKNVVVFPSRDSNLTLNDVDEDSLKKAREPVVLQTENCVFFPHVFSTIVGGSIINRNLDPTGHIASFSFFAGPALPGAVIPAGGLKRIDIKQAERAPIPVDCNLHPWMKAYVVVAETPFVGISDKDGELIINKLPANRSIKLKLWHESSKGAIEKVDLDGKIVTWKKGVIELNLKPGLNDLGVCKLTPEHFKN